MPPSLGELPGFSRFFFLLDFFNFLCLDFLCFFPLSSGLLSVDFDRDLLRISLNAADSPPRDLPLEFDLVLDLEWRFLFCKESKFLHTEFSLDLDLDLPRCAGLLGDLGRFLLEKGDSLSDDLLGCDLDLGDLDLSLVGLEKEGAN